MELVKKVPLVHLELKRDQELESSREPLTEADAAARWMKRFLGEADREYMLVCCVDNQMRPVCVQVVGIGTGKYCIFEMADLFKAALLSGASGILLFHNHPSGDPSPSKEDRERTERMREVSWKLEIPIWDHIILGRGNDYFSFAEEGLL